MKTFRLTVHLKDVQKTEVTSGRVKNAKGKFVDKKQTKLFNTLSFMVKDQDEINKTLAEVRKEYTIAKGTNPEKKDKFGKELINISFVK
tara:strand:+ start:297 stop:563 length:267 start_codon:yes stop_codon:yes gene_type:complete